MQSFRVRILSDKARQSPGDCCSETARPRGGVKGQEMAQVSAQVFMRAGASVELVEREHSHFFLWATCVECLTEILITVAPDQRETTVYILGATWRLLPYNRLREIRLCLLRL